MTAAAEGFPFAAIVGQERMKQALLLNAVHPAIGGVLVRGNKGTAKSTAVRALAAVLPSIEVTRGCPFSCDPDTEGARCLHCASLPEPGERVRRPVRIVTLPVGASEDRLTGSLDIERAIKTGEQAFEPGLLAAAHRGVLYVDEVNLLSDHLVDLLLDAAGMGQNYVERDGLSLSHPARFILVGTMNPEEGELRPQLLDRFGLMVDADGTFTHEERVEILRRRARFEAHPAAFAREWEAAQGELRARIVQAQARLPRIEVPEEMLEAIATICEEHEVDGLRADLAIHRTASALAAWRGHDRVDLDDVREASRLALVHRQRRQPFQPPEADQQRLDDTIDRIGSGSRPRERGSQPAPAPTAPSEDDHPPEGVSTEPSDDTNTSNPSEPPHEEITLSIAPIGQAAPLPAITYRRDDRRVRAPSGRRAASLTGTRRGRRVASRPASAALADLDLPASLRAAARRVARSDERDAFQVEVGDLHEQVREAHAAMLVVFVVDASGSMGARERMQATKGAILSLLTDAYQRRDRVALVTLRGADAEVVLPPTRSVEVAHHRLAELATGGRTPLGAGLDRARMLIELERRRDPDLVPLLVLISDGRANAATPGLDPTEAANAAAAAIAGARIRALVVDTEAGFVRLGRARALARTLGAEVIALADLDARALAQSIRRGR